MSPKNKNFVVDYRRIFDNSDEVIVFLDLLGNIIEINDRVTDWVGQEPEDLIGKNVFKLEIFSKETTKKMNQTFAKRLGGKKIKPYNMKFLAKNGKYQTCRVTAKILKGEKGDSAGVLVMVSNVTNLSNQLSEQLQKTEEAQKKYKALFENANDAIFIMDGIKFIDCNRKTLSFYKCHKKSDIIGYTPLDFSPTKQPDGKLSKPKARKYIKNALAGKAQKFYWQHTTKNGELFDAEVSLNKIVLGGKKYIQAIVRNISPRMNAIRQLQESEAKFRTVVTKAQPIIFILDKKGKFLLSEGKALRSLGLKPGQVVGKSALKIYKNYPAVIEGINKALNGQHHEDVIFVQNVYFDIFFSPYKDDRGEVIGVIGMATDITKIQEAKKKLEEVNRLKTEFMSIASHQLRSPLGSMRWMEEELINDKRTKLPAKIKIAIKKLYDSNLRVIELINDLLDVSRIEQNRIKESVQKVDLVKIIKSILKELDVEADKKNLHIEFDTSADSVTMTIDKILIRETIQNLISNAIKYNKRNGYVLIHLAKKGQNIYFDIANTGLTIPEDEHDKVFSKFYRSKKASQSDTEGTGLGLFVVKSYVSSWGGKIKFKSPAKFTPKRLPKQKLSGTKFYLVIPIKGSKTNVKNKK